MRSSRASRVARCVGLVACLLVLVFSPAVARARPIQHRDDDDESSDNQHHDHRRREDVLVEAFERHRALERALRHPENDLDVTGACGDVARRACEHVETARALVGEAKRLADAERRRNDARRDAQTTTTEDKGTSSSSSSSRSLLAVSRGRSRGRVTPTRRRASTPTRTPTNADAEREDARRRQQDEDEEAAKKRAEAIDDAKFEQLKSYPKGALREDPNELERALRDARDAAEKNPEDAAARAHAERLERKKRRMIDEFGTTTVDDDRSARSRNGDDDHWFMKSNDEFGTTTSYRRRRGARRRVSATAAKENYEYLLRKIPTVSKSYFDCVGQIITRDDAAALQNFIEFSGNRAYESVASPECRREYASKKARVVSFWNAEEDIARACADDVVKHCDGVEAGYGLIASCLWKAREKDAGAVATECGEALARVDAKTPTATETVVASEDTREDTRKTAQIPVRARPIESKESTRGKEPNSTEPAATPKKSSESTTGGEPEKMDDDVARRLREADAKVKFAEEAAAHASAQTRNLFACMTAAGVVYVVTRRGARKKLAAIARRLRRDSKGEHLG